VGANLLDLAMNNPRRSVAFLDQLLGFQQALDTASSVEEIAALACRMVERIAQNTKVRFCLPGQSPATTDPMAANSLHETCDTCPFAQSLTDQTVTNTLECRAGLAIGRRSVALRTHRHLHGFLLMTGSLAWTPGVEMGTVAIIAQSTAMALENRALQQRLETSNNHLRNVNQNHDHWKSKHQTKADSKVPWPVTDGPHLLVQALEESPSSILITTSDGTIDYVNPGFIKTTGYSFDEIRGKNPRLLKSGLTPADEYRAIWEVIGHGGIWRGEFHNRRRDGSLYWVAASISPVRDQNGVITHYVAVEEDITELKALQERLGRTEERYRGASEASRDGLFILDAIRDPTGLVEDFRFAEVNVIGCGMVGKSREDIVGRLLSEILPFARAKGFLEKYQRVFLHREVLDEQFEVEGASILPIWIHHTVVPLADGIAITSRNISELKRYEAALMAARAGAEEANAAKSVFLATMSHELRTPLNAILGFSELIRDQTFGPVGTQRYVDYAADIHASGRHLLDLITAILDLSKIEAGKLEIELTPVDLAPLLRQCVSVVRTRAEKHGLYLVEDFAQTPFVIWADARAIRQIMLNVLSNAVKFTPSGGTITIHLAIVDSDWVDLSISDTGIGIPDDQLDRVMKPFEQLDNRYTRGAGGTGLGLALVKALAELHGGSVTLISKVNQGTTVIIRIPRQGSRHTAAIPWSFNLGGTGL
jgi:PAS domain S-box-containing protein